MKRTTLKQIAEQSGTSIAAASLAMRNSPKIKRQTGNRIRSIAKKLNYHPCHIGRSLVLGKTYFVGITIPSYIEPICTDLTEFLQAELRKHGYLGIVINANTPELMQESIHRFLSLKVDGIISTSLFPENAHTLLRENVPFVLTANPLSAPGPSVTINKHLAITLAMEHVIALGHRTIGYIGNTTKTELKYTVYREILERSGLRFEESWVFNGLGFPETGIRGIHHILALPEQPSAIICFNDVVAIGAVSALLHAGVRVPDEMSVIGFDGIRAGETYYPAITTLRHPIQEQARLVVETLLDQIARPTAVAPHIILDPELVIRESCGKAEERRKGKNEGQKSE